MSAKDDQVGGRHYKDMAIQPIEYIFANKFGFAEGSVIKYVSRWRDKGGVEDLRKARHILDMLIEYETVPPKEEPKQSVEETPIKDEVPKPLCVEAGKRYVTKRGDVTSVLERTGESLFKFSGIVAGCWRTWTEAGRIFTILDSDHDLVREYVEQKE